MNIKQGEVKEKNKRKPEARKEMVVYEHGSWESYIKMIKR